MYRKKLTPTANKSNPNKKEKLIDINVKEINLLYDTGSDISLISYECYVDVG